MIGNVLSSLVGDLIHLLKSPRHRLHFNKEFNLNLAMDSIFPTHTRTQYSGTCLDANIYSGGCMHTAAYSGTKIGLDLVSSERSSCSYGVPQKIWHQNPLFEIFHSTHATARTTIDDHKLNATQGCSCNAHVSCGTNQQMLQSDKQCS